MSADPPGVPAVVLIWTPDTLAESELATEVAGTLLNCAASTLATDTVSFFLGVPSATPETTISSRSPTSVVISTLNVFAPTVIDISSEMVE